MRSAGKFAQCMKTLGSKIITDIGFDTAAHDTVILLALIHVTTSRIAAGDTVALLDHIVEKEGIDVLLLVSIKEEVVVEGALEVRVVVVEDVVVDHPHQHLFTTHLTIGIPREEEAEAADPLLRQYLKKTEIEEPYLSLNWRLV